MCENISDKHDIEKQIHIINDFLMEAADHRLKHMGLKKKEEKAITKWKEPVGKALTHWGRVTHLCVSELTIIGSDNGLSPGRRQVIIWTSAGILLIGPLGTNFSELSIKILTFPFTEMRLKVSSAKWRPFCVGLNVLTKDSKDPFIRGKEKWDQKSFSIILKKSIILAQKNIGN